MRYVHVLSGVCLGSGTFATNEHCEFRDIAIGNIEVLGYRYMQAERSSISKGIKGHQQYILDPNYGQVTRFLPRIKESFTIFFKGKPCATYWYI